MKDYKKLTQDEINDEFVEACKNGDLELIKYLLTSPKLKNHADIHVDNDYGFKWACHNGYLEVVKYLLASPELKEHVAIPVYGDYGFKAACENGRLGIIKYLIFDVDIEKTYEIKEFLKYEKYQEIENLFKIRDLNKQLENELNFSYNSDNKKNKL